MLYKNTCAVLGAGTWGIALARMLKNCGKDVTVWSALPEEIELLKRSNTHPKLPQMVLPEGIHYTTDLEQACAEKSIIVFAVPSVFVRTTARAAKPYIPDGQIIVDVAKGLEPDTFMTLTEVIADELRNPTVRTVALSGPTHAEEVAVDLPTTIVSACEDLETACAVQQFFTSPFLRVYTNTDVRGIEICGALKNVIALASGIASGLGFGDNARAAIITRGIAELARLGTKLGCHPETFSGLAGLGDLVVTCTSEHSRNNRAGKLIGRGLSAEEATKEVGMVVEGLNALPAAVTLCERFKVDMPLVCSVDAIVNKGISPKEAVNALLSRELKNELADKLAQGMLDSQSW